MLLSLFFNYETHKNTQKMHSLAVLFPDFRGAFFWDFLG